MEDKEMISKTNFYSACKDCGHTRDWHERGDLFWGQIFGVALGECSHYTKDETLPFWKRWKKYCDCKQFVNQDGGEK